MLWGSSPIIRTFCLLLIFAAAASGPVFVTAEHEQSSCLTWKRFTVSWKESWQPSSESRTIHLRGGENNEEEPRIAESIGLRKNSLKLDLSGRLKCLVLKGRSDTSSSTKPLLDNRPSHYTVAAGVDYDFQNYWYGLSRLFSGIRIKLNPAPDERERLPSTSPLVPQWLQPRSISRGIPHFADIEVEKGILGNDQYAATQISFSWDDEPLFGQEETSLAEQPLSLSVRLDTENALGWSWSLPIQSRLLWKGRVVRKYDISREIGPSELGLPASNVDNPSNWLVPNLSINTLGDLQIRNQLWTAPSDDGRRGLRLTIRRRCAFDFLATATNQGNEWTWIGLEVEGRSAVSRTITRLEAALEAPVASAQMVVSQDWLL